MNNAQRSLSDVHGSVGIPKNTGLIKRILAFAGPAYLVSVGYMDPGNWATDLEGGARFGYQLLWVLVMSNAMAILLQTLSARMGIAAGRDLAQACREYYPKPVSYVLWFICEIAIAACDLAEVLGTAIGLNLLFGLPLIYGVIITGFDTMLFLMIQQFGIRKMEAFIIMLVTTIGVCFGIELFFAKPDLTQMATGLIPQLNSESLYVAIGILGATVMPHNLYLHSSIVQTRRYEPTAAGRREAITFATIDSTMALGFAFFINAAILILAAAAFHWSGHQGVAEIQQAYQLLSPTLGVAGASTLFAIALLASGQNSTLTGTLAGQIVMEGFLDLRLRPWLRRLITRAIAIVPAVCVIGIWGEGKTTDLLVASQVMLSMQLGFAVWPLLRFTGDRAKMGEFANPVWIALLGWTCAAIIITLNVKLLLDLLLPEAVLKSLYGLFGLPAPS